MINKEKIKQSLDCDDDFLNVLLDQFVIESKESTKNMNRSLEDKNWDGVRGSAHKMLSSTKLLGMPELTDLLEKIETRSANGNDLDVVPDLVNKYTNSIEGVYKEIETV